jgi:hypothetical protein
MATSRTATNSACTTREPRKDVPGSGDPSIRLRIPASRWKARVMAMLE